MPPTPPEPALLVGWRPPAHSSGNRPRKARSSGPWRGPSAPAARAARPQPRCPPRSSRARSCPP
eukprot:2472418-Lingulodinium_polyedra.AAC.1